MGEMGVVSYPAKVFETRAVCWVRAERSLPKAFEQANPPSIELPAGTHPLRTIRFSNGLFAVS
jgi:hypothetical protein